MRDRDRVRSRDCGLCQDCLERGIVRPGTDVDHIVPLSAGGTDSDDNKRLLCRTCHLEKTRQERQGRGV